MSAECIAGAASRLKRVVPERRKLCALGNYSHRSAVLLALSVLWVGACTSQRNQSLDTTPPVPSASTPPAAMPAAAVAGTLEQSWSLLELGGVAVIVANERARPSLTFDAKSRRVSGMAGVNRFSGTYQATDDTVAMGPLMATKMAGPPEMNELETNYLRALGEMKRWRVIGGKLELRSGKGELVALFGARPQP